jgi:predicted ArsR family transcriptional regulator
LIYLICDPIPCIFVTILFHQAEVVFMKQWGKRFLSSTRGQVVELLRRGEATVNELAEALNLTNNAVRAHLTTLERDRLVRPSGKRSGVRKPETLYALTPEAEQLFPKAYHLLLNQLLTVLGKRFSPDEIEEILREVGQSLAAGSSSSLKEMGLRARAEKALQVLKSLGGLADLQETSGGLVIRGYSCPLAAAVNVHPEVCQLAEALLTDIIGAPVQETCERNGTPRCIFQIGQADS